MAKKDRRSKKRRGGKGKGKKRFKYQQRSKERWQERAEQSGYNKRSMVIDGVKSFRPKSDDNLVRILPPTFEDADHYGYEVYVHWNVGPDNDAFLCLKAMQGEDCPICEEKARALKDNDKDYADKLNAKKRVFCYVVDRDEEDEGLLLWAMPWTLDRDVTTLAVDKRTGEVLAVDDPEDGYDVEFTKQGKGRNTEYVGVAIARKRSALDNDEALDDAIERPVPECLKFYTYDEIDKVFNAGGGAYDDDDDDDDRPRKKKDKGKKDKGKKKKYDEDKDEVTWDEVQEMDLDELAELTEDQELDIDCDIDEEDEDDLEGLRDEICHELDLEKPKKRKPKKKEKEKLRKRGRRR